MEMCHKEKETSQTTYHAFFPFDWSGCNLCSTFFLEGVALHELCIFKIGVGFKVLAKAGEKNQKTCGGQLDKSNLQKHLNTHLKDT